MSYRRSECENGPGGEAAGSVFVEKSPVGKFERPLIVAAPDSGCRFIAGAEALRKHVPALEGLILSVIQRSRGFGSSASLVGIWFSNSKGYRRARWLSMACHRGSY